MHSGVYSKSETPVKRTFTSRPVESLGSTIMVSLTFWWGEQHQVLLRRSPAPGPPPSWLRSGLGDVRRSAVLTPCTEAKRVCVPHPTSPLTCWKFSCSPSDFSWGLMDRMQSPGMQRTAVTPGLPAVHGAQRSSAPRWESLLSVPALPNQTPPQKKGSGPHIPLLLCTQREYPSEAVHRECGGGEKEEQTPWAALRWTNGWQMGTTASHPAQEPTVTAPLSPTAAHPDVPSAHPTSPPPSAGAASPGSTLDEGRLVSRAPQHR